MAQSSRDTCILVAVCLLMFFANLGAAPLWDRDEPRNAACGAEMLDRGDWVVPWFNSELRAHKPILLYWLMMSAYTVFGVNEFGARFVSASAGLGTVLLTYRIATHLFSTSKAARSIGLWAGVMLSSTIMFAMASRAATPDALLIFCGTLSIYFYVRGTFPSSFRENGVGNYPMPTGFNLYAMYAAMGLGLLAKGPVGMILPTAVIGMYLLIVTLPRIDTPSSWLSRAVACLRPFAPLHFLRTVWSMRPLTALATAFAIALPWYVLVHLKTDGAWTTEFFFTHNVSRASATMEGHSGPPVFFYVAAILVGFFPWSILTIPTFLEATTELRRSSSNQSRNALVLMLCWVGVYVGLFSIAKTKLPSYVTPCYPALAILFGHFVGRWAQSAQLVRPTWIKVGLAHWVVVGFGLLIGLPIAANQMFPGSEWLGVIGVIPLVGGVLCWRCVSREQYDRAQNYLMFTAVAFVVLAMGVLPAEVGRHRVDGNLLSHVRKHTGPVVAYGQIEPSLVFYARKPIRIYAKAERDELVDYVNENPDAFLLTTHRELSLLAKEESELNPMRVIDDTEYFLKDTSLFLVAPRSPAIANQPKNVR